MRARASVMAIAMGALWATVGCPQLRDDDFASRLDAGSAASGNAGTTAGDGLGGSAGGNACPAGSGGCGVDAEAGSAGAGVAGSAGSSSLPRADGGAEIECGSDALTADDGLCYFVDSTETTWAEARTNCQARGDGWDLVTISDATQNDFVLSITGFEAWIGATDVADEGSWSWLDEGSPFFVVDAATNTGFTNWSSGEPNDLDGSDCLRILTTGQWADWPCDGPFGSVCSRTP